MSGSSYPTLSMLISLYNALIDHMENYMFEDENANENEDETKTNDTCVIVAILDPRLKMEYYNDKTWNDDQRKEIREKFLNVYNSTYSNPNLSSTLSNSLNNEYKNSITSKVFKRKCTQEIDEFQVYLLSTVCDESVDLLQYIPLEECFSISKNLITDKCNKLAGKTIRSCMCLKSWFSVSLSDLFE
ncbi:hypothetical protein C1646_771909 [Rhizophagus diaphanus]|nr:hypothetical protein C1646_771909 [Rhizophagus diaphanus] [Rhizophagus sp. MUCL 43196]